MARGAQTRSGRRRLAGLAAAVALALAGAAGAQTQHQDALPPKYPPGYEPVDVEAEVREKQAEDRQKLQSDVDFEMRARTTAPEARLRARYGSATWNLYEPSH